MAIGHPSRRGLFPAAGWFCCDSISPKKVPPPTPEGHEGRLFPPEQSFKSEFGISDLTSRAQENSLRPVEIKLETALTSRVKLGVRYETAYRYAAPVNFSIHEIRLFPAGRYLYPRAPPEVRDQRRRESALRPRRLRQLRRHLLISATGHRIALPTRTRS